MKRPALALKRPEYQEPSGDKMHEGHYFGENGTTAAKTTPNLRAKHGARGQCYTGHSHWVSRPLDHVEALPESGGKWMAAPLR
jgi:hypothetical protein